MKLIMKYLGRCHKTQIHEMVNHGTCCIIVYICSEKAFSDIVMKAVGYLMISLIPKWIKGTNTTDTKTYPILDQDM